MKTISKTLFLIGILAFSHAQQAERPLRVAMSDLKFPFHPHLADTSAAHQVFTGLFETLVVLDPQTLFPEPGIAEAWNFSDNGRVLTLNLRPGIRWSNGEPITAQDIIETWFGLIDPESKSPWVSLLDDVVNASDFRSKKVRDRNQVGFRAQGNSIRIDLRRPSPHFITVLAHYSLSPLHRSMRNQAPVNPVGMVVNGPYKVESYNQNRLVLVRNDQYWDKAFVSISRIEIQMAKDADAVSRAFSRGEIDWLDHILNPELILNRDDIKFNPSYSVSYLFFNASRAPYSDERVRRALVLLLDHQTLREEEVFNTASFVPPIPPYPTVKGIDNTDKKEAENLLRAAGFPNGRGLPAIRIVFPESEYFKRRAEIIRKSWEGFVQTEVVFIPWERFYDQIKTENFQLSFHSWIGDFPDPLTFLILFEGGSSLNISQLNDQRYNQLLNESRTKLEANARFQTYGQAEERLLSSGALIPLSFGYSIHAIDTNLIGGWSPNLLDFHPYKKLKFTGNRLGPNFTMRPNN